jgi:hypothetical protein
LASAYDSTLRPCLGPPRRLGPLAVALAGPLLVLEVAVVVVVVVVVLLLPLEALGHPRPLALWGVGLRGGLWPRIRAIAR